MKTRNHHKVELGDVWQFHHMGFNLNGTWGSDKTSTFLVVGFSETKDRDGLPYVRDVWCRDLKTWTLQSYGFETGPERYRLLARIEDLPSE
jgi:hypothetical protein